MRHLTIGLIQERWHPDPAEHRHRLATGIRAAAVRGAQIICLQELTLSPYFATRPGLDPTPYAETIPDGPTCRFVRSLAYGSGRFRHRLAVRGRRP